MSAGGRVTILGARGSVPASGPGFGRYGGGTACVLVRLGGQVVVLDAGTGLMALGSFLAPDERTFTLLLTHAHLDHLAGLPACPLLFDPAYSVSLLAAERDGRGTLEQIRTLMSPPLWPVGPESFTAHLEFGGLTPGSFFLGPVRVDTLDGCHPGGSTVFRLSYEKDSLVYATDYELTSESAPPLSAFARDCSLLLCDGQYTRPEAALRRGFGHSAWEEAALLARSCGAKALRVFHHDPARTDDELDAFARELELNYPGAAFARYGEEIVLS